MNLLTVIRLSDGRPVTGDGVDTSSLDGGGFRTSGMANGLRWASQAPSFSSRERAASVLRAYGDGLMGYIDAREQLVGLGFSAGQADWLLSRA